MTSSWIVKGAHALSFRKWMELDCQYVRERSMITDIQIVIQTIRLMLRFIYMEGYEIYRIKKAMWKKSG